ncbi:hypothetical protein D3C78_1508660 [compost metagenome]
MQQMTSHSRDRLLLKERRTIFKYAFHRALLLRSHQRQIKLRYRMLCCIRLQLQAVQPKLGALRILHNEHRVKQRISAYVPWQTQGIHQLLKRVILVLKTR